MKFASVERLEIVRLLDGEPLDRILRTLTGRESDREILSLLKSKIDRLESVVVTQAARVRNYELRKQSKE